MGVQLGGTVPNVVQQTHEPSGVTVTFRRPGHLERTAIIAAAAGNIGAIIQALAEPGVGVVKWTGVERQVGPSMVAVPYTPQALDEVVAATEPAAISAAESAVTAAGLDRLSDTGKALWGRAFAEHSFGGWFNDRLLELVNLKRDGTDRETDDPGKSSPPAA